MARELKSPTEIWHQVKYLVGASIPGATGKLLRVPRPERLARPDASGCNWRIQFNHAAAEHVARAEAVIESMRSRWNMQ